MGIPVNNPCFICGDNLAVLWNTTVPDSMLKKKTSSITELNRYRKMSMCLLDIYPRNDEYDKANS